jgi:hypothetical protein
MITLKSKVNRLGWKYLTFVVRPEGEALEHSGLIFRPQQLIKVNGEIIRAPQMFKEYLDNSEEVIKYKFQPADDDVTIVVGIVKEGYKWFETLTVEL